MCEKYRDADSIIIDIPLGLAENRNDLRPDIELRKKLKGKVSSVFNTPCRQAVYARDYTETIEENIKALELSLSPPSYGFTRKIREVDIFLEQNTEWKNKLVESHPEYCFMMLNSGKPIIEKKTKPDGQDKRLEVLSKYYPDALDVIKKFKSDVPSRRKIDDVIDALCLAIIGVKGLENGFVTIPNIPEKDSKGIQMQIVGANLF